MTVIEQIYAIVKTLPQNQASEILAFAEFIRAKYLNAHKSTDTVDSLTSWQELVYALGGTWAEDFPTLEEIRSESGEDILRESF
ncbi:DUF2281 domain-containing protein [Microcoleus sp. bin38.metabat.b11b12b14.051]|uniref:DUF2281 domain-containing protein n=1 Tax=Microcoleus sp. bin38.metabat.b11b12b14.051 TaxID=2742709 RepID=UPI0025D9D317|nr:DUF2281 domain-containing protein [Microcoleus sp. bin38.metabat.b11b12b14.051]